MTHRLMIAINRLQREIQALQAKLAPCRSNYNRERDYKRAVTIRLHAIADRQRKITEYREKLKRNG